jgi:hypothetical protein
MAAPNPEQFKGLDPGFYLTKGDRGESWANQNEVQYTYQDELGYGATLDVGDRRRMELPTMTPDEATGSIYTGTGTAYARGAQGELFKPGSHPRAHTFHGNYRGRMNSARLGVLAGLHERKNTGPLDVSAGMSLISRNMTLKVGKAAQRHGIDFVGNMAEQATDNPAANWTDEDRRQYSSHGRGWTPSLEEDEEGNRKPNVEVPNALYVAGRIGAPEGNTERFQTFLDEESEKQEERLAGGSIAGEATMRKFSDSEVKEAQDFTRAIFRTPEPEPAPEYLLQRHEITDNFEPYEDKWGRTIEPSTNRRSMPGQQILDFPEWTPLERALTAGRNRARGELKAMARKNTRRPSQIEQPTMSKPAPTLRETVQNLPRETVEELAAQEEVAYSQGYDDANTDSGWVDPVAEGALYGENLQGGGGTYGFENLPSRRNAE